MESLWWLDIEKTGIKELPSIAYFTRVQTLKASGCELQNIQLLSFGKKVKFDEVLSCRTEKLLHLYLEECNLSERDFLVPLDCWSALTFVDLSKNNFVSLPDCISEAVNLETLYLRDCKTLREIPVLPPKLIELHLDDCTSLEKIPDKLPLSLEHLNLNNYPGPSCVLSADEAAKLEYKYLNEEIDLSRNNFVSLSDWFRKAVNLKTLYLRDCKRLREIPVLPPKLESLHLDGCSSLEKIPKLPPRLRELSLCNCSGLSDDEVAKLENNLLNEEIDPHSKLSIIYPGNEISKWFSYTSNHPTTIQPLPAHEWNFHWKEEFVGGSEYRFEIPLKLQVGETLLGWALSFVIEPSTCYSHDYSDVNPFVFINGELLTQLEFWYDEDIDIKATHVRLALVGLDYCAKQYVPMATQPGDICQVVFRFHKGCPIKSCGVHCLLRNQDSGSSSSEDEEDEEQEQEQPSDSDVPFDIEEDEKRQRLRQQQQILQSMPQLQRAQLQQQQQQQQILSWEFCARRHGELLPRRLVAPQVNQLVQVAQKCQSTIAESGSDGISQQDLQTNSNMVPTAGRQLAKSLELQSLNDLGFSERYERWLQISKIVNSMKDLFDFCRENKVGPIEGLKLYPRHATAAKLQMQKIQEMELLASAQGLPTDRNTLNKLMALHPGLNNQMNNHHQMVGPGAYQNLLLRHNSMNSNGNSLQQEASSSFNNSNHSPSSTFQSATALIPGSMHNLPGSALSSPHLPSRQPQQLQQRSLSSNSLLQQTRSTGSQGNQALQQQMIQPLLQEMSNNSGGAQQSLPCPSANGSVGRNGVSFGGNNPAAAPSTSNVSGSHGPAPSRNNSFKATANSDNSTGGGGNNTYNQRAPDLPSNLHLQEDLVQEIAREFTENGFFNSNPEDNVYPQISSDIVLRPTSSLGKRPHPRGSSDVVDDEYDHPKRRQIDIEEEEEQEQPFASDDPQFQIS